MRTQAQAVDWTLKQIGKALDYDGMWGAQCVDLIRFYVRHIGAPQFPSTPSAKNLWTVNWSNQHFDKLQASNTPRPGDIVVWDGSPTNSHGHTEVVVAVHSNNSFDSVGQNYRNFNLNNGSPGSRQTHNRTNRILGWIRPKFASAPAPSPKPSGGKYTIKSGDTFWGIEQANKWPTGTLQGLNKNQDPRKLRVGQTINVPTGKVSNPLQPTQRVHTVAKGENLWSIGQRYGVPYTKIHEANRKVIGNNPALIRPGQKLRIP